MGKLSRQKRLRRQLEDDLKLKRGDISKHGRKTPPIVPVAIDACGCGAAIERGALLCRYCMMKIERIPDAA